MNPIIAVTPKTTSVITSSFEDVVGRAGSVRFMVGIVGWSHGRKPARYIAMKIVQEAMEPKAIRYLRFMIRCLFCGSVVGGFIGNVVVDVEGGVFGGGVFVNWYRTVPFNT